MQEKSYSRLLRNLANDYYRNYISLDEYRAQRKKILDQIDLEINNRQAESEETGEQELNSILMGTIAFDTTKDLEP